MTDGSVVEDFPIVDGLPVLVDFDDSILSREGLLSTTQSVIDRPRYRGLAAFGRRLASPPNAISRDNARRLRSAVSGSAGARPRILIVGGASLGDGLEGLYRDESVDIYAFDVYGSPLVQFIADAHAIPLPAGFVDAVVIQAVLHVVLRPQTVVSEIHRVLRPGGLVYAETPFMQQVHEGAYDFQRFTDSGHRYLFRDFDLIDSGPLDGPGSAVVWSLDFLLRGLIRRRSAGALAKAALFWLRIADRVTSTPYRIDSTTGVFFLGRRATRTINPRDLIPYYKGAQKRRLARN